MTLLLHPCRLVTSPVAGRWRWCREPTPLPRDGASWLPVSANFRHSYAIGIPTLPSGIFVMMCRMTDAIRMSCLCSFAALHVAPRTDEGHDDREKEISLCSLTIFNAKKQRWEHQGNFASGTTTSRRTLPRCVGGSEWSGCKLSVGWGSAV